MLPQLHEVIATLQMRQMKQLHHVPKPAQPVIVKLASMNTNHHQSNL